MRAPKINRTLFTELLSLCLVPLGFRRSNLNWYRSFPEVIQVLNLQSAGYAGQHHLNIGICLRGVCDLEEPKHHECQLRTRLECLASETPREQIERVLCLSDHDLNNDQRQDEFKKLVLGNVIPFLESTTTESDIRLVVIEMKFNIMLIDRIGRVYLKLADA